jgi:hypothetical protein
MSYKWSNGICAFLNVYGKLCDVESVKYDNRHARNEINLRKELSIEVLIADYSYVRK